MITFQSNVSSLPPAGSSYEVMGICSKQDCMGEEQQVLIYWLVSKSH